jgi:phosphoglycolate phosphatase-like HAD superfamily hydrolase
MKLRGIIFDLDGTLANTMEVCLLAFQDTLQKFDGRTISLQELFGLFGPSEEGILQRLLPNQGEEAYRYYLNSYEHFHNACPEPFPGVEALLDHIRAIGLHIAIATGKSAETAEISMRILRLSSRIERLETGFIDRGDKPQLIRRVVESWGFPLKRVAYVGDVPTDLYAAEQAGVLPIGAAWAETSALRQVELKEGWFVFERVEDLMTWISTG